MIACELPEDMVNWFSLGSGIRLVQTRRCREQDGGKRQMRDDLGT